jgi:hypothetical protein
MLKAGLKAVESIGKATKTKSLGDIARAAGDTAKIVQKIPKKKKKERAKR